MSGAMRPDREGSEPLAYDPAHGRNLIERSLVEALRRIANEDYRGNRPQSARIAEEALRRYELDLQIGMG